MYGERVARLLYLCVMKMGPSSLRSRVALANKSETVLLRYSTSIKLEQALSDAQRVVH